MKAKFELLQWVTRFPRCFTWGWYLFSLSQPCRIAFKQLLRFQLHEKWS